MTTLREAAQQALEALELALAPFPLDDIRCQKAAEALRAALAEPGQEPVALESVYETIIQWDEGGGKRSRRELARRIVDLYTTSPQRKPRHVSYVCPQCHWSLDERKPLTEVDMLNIIDDMLEGGSLVDVARAIERAHGIKDA